MQQIYRRTPMPKCDFSKGSCCIERCFCRSPKCFGEDTTFLFYRLRPANLLRKRLRHRCFSMNFTNFKNTQFQVFLNEPLIYYLSIRDVAKKREHYIHIFLTYLDDLIKASFHFFHESFCTYRSFLKSDQNSSLIVRNQSSFRMQWVKHVGKRNVGINSFVKFT